MSEIQTIDNRTQNSSAFQTERTVFGRLLHFTVRSSANIERLGNTVLKEMYYVLFEAINFYLISPCS